MTSHLKRQPQNPGIFRSLRNQLISYSINPTLQAPPPRTFSPTQQRTDRIALGCSLWDQTCRRIEAKANFLKLNRQQTAQPLKKLLTLLGR